MPKRLLKVALQAVVAAWVWPAAALTGFGRWESMFSILAHVFALYPGVLGDYFRSSYYWLTLEQFPLSSRIQFGSFFSHPQAKVGAWVYIGSYCVLGRTEIGDRTQIASAVQILSGRHQHVRDESGGITGAEAGRFTSVSIGSNCWIGAAALVMADVGDRSTIGAGSVVTRPVPAGCVAVGNPARVITTVVEAN